MPGLRHRLLGMYENPSSATLELRPAPGDRIPLSERRRGWDSRSPPLRVESRASGAGRSLERAWPELLAVPCRPSALSRAEATGMAGTDKDRVAKVEWPALCHRHAGQRGATDGVKFTRPTPTERRRQSLSEVLRSATELPGKRKADP